MFLIQKIAGRFSEYPLKKQMLVLFLPITLLVVWIIGIFAYAFEAEQVKTNARYLAESTTSQTATVLDDKLETIFTQLAKFSESVPVGNLLINDYGDRNGRNEYNDIISTYRDMQNIYYMYGDVIHSIYFQTSSGTQISAYKELSHADPTIDLNKWFTTYQDSQYGYYWRNVHTNDVFKGKNEQQVLTVFRNMGNETSNRQGVVIFNLNADYFKNILNQSKISRNGYMLLVGPDSIMQPQEIQQGYQLSEKDLLRLQNQSKDDGILRFTSKGGKAMTVTFKRLQSSRWLVAAAAPESDFVEMFSQFRYVLILLIAVLMAVFIVLCNLFAQSIAKPIAVLSQKVKQFDKGDDAVDFMADIADKNEIGTLAAGISGLKQSVFHLVEQVKFEQTQKSHMQLMAMQEQIKPHFLYNTLASIRHLIDLGDEEQASHMCSALERFYRIGISGGQEVISVREEILHVKTYLEIQKMRYAQNFDYQIDVEEEILETPILRLMLQPIAENAIYHGIKQKEGCGTILLTGRREGQTVMFQIYDDGVGMEPEQLAKLRSVLNQPVQEGEGKNFGIRNVNQRLALYFGKKDCLQIDSIPDVYTQVTITVPWNGKGGDKHVQTSDCG